MKIITVNLSEPQIRALQILQDLGLYPSRSEGIRVAIRDFLQRELGFAQKFDDVQKIPTTQEKAASPTKEIDKKKEIARLLRRLRDEQPDINKVI